MTSMTEDQFNVPNC